MTFARPTLAELIERTDQDILTGLGLGAILPRSVEYAIGRALALLAHGLHGNLAWAARQLFPDTADAEYLDQWAAVWGLSRKQAAVAAGFVTLTGTNGSVAPEGTQLRNSAGAVVALVEDATIVAGTASVEVSALEPGALANVPEGGGLTFVSPVAGIQSSAVAGDGGISGGADAEPDDELRERLLTRIQQPPSGGSSSDYLLWALSVPGVTRAWVRPLWDGPATVGVLFVLDDNPGDILPNPAKIAEVQEYLDERRPVTAQPIALAPVALEVDFTIQLTPNTAAVRQAVTEALADLFEREANPGVPITLSQLSEAISTAPGEQSHVLVAPAADIVPQPAELPLFGEITWA
jgi:uncharacterized phage protein gp47/JayE